MTYKNKNEGKKMKIINKIKETKFPKTESKDGFSIHAVEILIELKGDIREKTSKAGNSYTEQVQGFYLQKHTQSNGYESTFKNVPENVYNKIAAVSLPAQVEFIYEVNDTTGEAYITDVKILNQVK